jgi:hypothetical protein
MWTLYDKVKYFYEDCIVPEWKLWRDPAVRSFLKHTKLTYHALTEITKYFLGKYIFEWICRWNLDPHFARTEVSFWNKPVSELPIE